MAMEDYDKFVQRRVSCLNKNNDSNKPSSTTSVIRFYGHPILPPLLTEGKRAEMQRHREEAQTAAVHRRMKDAARLADLQAMLQRQQLFQPPTLEGLLHESESDEKSSLSHDSSGVSVLQNTPFTGATGMFLYSPPPEEKEKDESHLCATEYEHQRVPLKCNNDKDHSFDRHSGFSDNPDLSEALSTNHTLTADLHTRQESTKFKLEPNVDLGGVEPSLRPFSEPLQETETRTNAEKSDASLVPVTENLLVPSLSGSKENDGDPAPPLVVTACNAFSAAPQPEHQKNCLISQHMSQQVPTNCLQGLSHQSVIHDLLKTTSVSSGSVAGRDRHMFGSPDGAYDVGSVFQHSPSNTIAEMPKIICYPPVDGDELEHSGLESLLGYGFIISKGISRSLGMPDPSVNGDCDPHLYSTASKVYPSLSSVITYNKDHNPELFQSLKTHQLPTIQRDAAVTQSDKAKPECINLQALLKRSQEYRQHQQMLRSKSKNREVQVKTRELTRAKTDEQSLSDKKNNELLHKRTETTNEGKPNERKSTFIPAEQTKNFWEKCKMAESQFLCNLTNSKSEKTYVQGDGGEKEISSIQEETTIGNDPINVSQEVTVKKKPTSSSLQQHCKGSRKYRMTRAATFSQSPVFWKSESSKSIRQCEDSGPRRDADDNRFNKEHRVNEATFDQAGSSPSLFTVSHTIVGELPNHPTTSSEHIDLIESSLWDLKAQILDLESTLGVPESLEDCSQTESEMHSDKQHVQVFPSDCVYLWDGLSHSVTNTDAKCLRQLLKEMYSEEENPRPEPSEGHDDPPLLISRKGPQVVNSGEHGLIQTLNTEEAILNVVHEEEPLTCKGVPHEAQQDQIPEAFPNISAETEVSSKFSEISQTNNQPEEENKAAVACRFCGQPSEQWFLQGSGSELGSKGHPGLENHHTPERGDEFQGRFWRIKRKLLTRTKKETDRNSSDDGRGQESALRLSLRDKTWTIMGQGSQKCGQKQSAADWPEGDSSGDEEEQQKQDHIAQDRSQQEEPSRQQEELLQPGSTPPERFRPLLVAVVKGFLTRRLFKTERVKKLVCVIRDMQQLLNTLQQPNSLWKEIVTLKAVLHLSAARSEISEIFFGMSAGVRMQIISQDRELIHERELRQKSVQTDRPRRKSCLSAATQKSLERKRERLLAAIKSKAPAQGQLKANCASSPRTVL